MLCAQYKCLVFTRSPQRKLFVENRTCNKIGFTQCDKKAPVTLIRYFISNLSAGKSRECVRTYVKKGHERK